MNKPVEKLKTVTDFKEFFQKIPKAKWTDGYFPEEGIIGEKKPIKQACALGHIGLAAKKDLYIWHETDTLKEFKHVKKLNELFLKHFERNIMGINDYPIDEDDILYKSDKDIVANLKKLVGKNDPRARILAALKVIESKTSKKKTKKILKKAKKLVKKNTPTENVTLDLIGDQKPADSVWVLDR